MRPVPREIVDLLPTRQLQSVDFDSDSRWGCDICPEAHEGDVVMILPCGHEYHDKCIRPWFQQMNTCPMCRKPVCEEEEEEQQEEQDEQEEQQEDGTSAADWVTS